MAEQRKLVIPMDLRSNETFIQDLSRFVLSSEEFKETLSSKLSPTPPNYGVIADAELHQISEHFGYNQEELQRIMYLFNLIKQQLLETHQPPEHALSDISSLLEIECTEGRQQEIVAAFSYTDEERTEYSALRALSSGPAYISSSFRPSLISNFTGSELVGIHFMTLSYINTDGDQRSVTIGFSPGELEQLESAIEYAKHQLEVMQASRVEGNEGR